MNHPVRIRGSVYKFEKSFFLNPSNKKLWTYLACIYESGGFKEDALAMINTYKALFGPHKEGKEAHAVCQSDADCVLAPCSRPPVVSEIVDLSPPVSPSPEFDVPSQGLMSHHSHYGPLFLL